MAGKTRRTVLILAATFAAGTAPGLPARAQDAGASAAQGLRMSDPRVQRLPVEELRFSDPGADETLLGRDSDPGALRDIEPAEERPGSPETAVDEPEAPEAAQDAATQTTPAAPDFDFDLFEGPEERAAAPAAPLTRGPAPQASEAQAPGAGTGIQPDAAATIAAVRNAPPATRAFQSVGPVRSPTFAPAAGVESVNRAVVGLRPSFPTFETDPFAADGIRVGTFRLYPVLQQDIGVSDNLDDDPVAEGGAFSETSLSARFLSDWSRHEADVNASAVYRRNFGGTVEDDPRLAVDARLRLDLADQTTAIVRAAASFAREDPIEADPLLPPAGRPDILAYSVGADLAREFGPIDLSGGADVVREERRRDNLLVSEDFTTASLGLRAGYELSAAFQPFVSGSVGRRIFDERDPFTGTTRDSDIYGVRSGLAFDFGEKISGEAAIGYAWNVPVDGSLPQLGAPTADIAVNWSPHRGTDVLLSAATFFDPEQTNLSTSTVYESAIALRHRATARTDLTARLSAAFRDRQGEGLTDETTYAAEAGFNYWINRGLAFTGLARHQQLKTSLAQAEYDSNSIRVGLRLQR